MIDQAIQRAQAYYFFSHALLYPQENWAGEMALLEGILHNLEVDCQQEGEGISADLNLEELQAHHRAIFGLTGSVVYETELGLPHEFRQSQELADISGFYQAFGFRPGGRVRERPDYMATELEFMYLLNLKEAHARSACQHEQAEICADAQRVFLQDHLSRWSGPFCRSLLRSAEAHMGSPGRASPYIRLARSMDAFITSEAQRQQVAPQIQPLNEQNPTPFNPDYNCAGCAVAEASS